MDQPTPGTAPDHHPQLSTRCLTDVDTYRTGAASHTRRTLTACTAGSLAVLGIVLGTVGAYAALVAGYHAQLYRLTPLPVAQLVPLALGLPIVAMIAGWLLAGREPRTFSRQALD
jgi:putative ABC transport system permease protein